MNKVTVSVPASTANLGPGFDCLALALDLYNSVDVEVRDGGLEILIEGEGANQLPRDDSNLCYQAFKKVFEASDCAPPNIQLRSVNRIPLSSGLGSSSAAIIAGLLAADTLLGSRFSPSELLKLVLDFEDHLDNAAAALLGGFMAVLVEGDEILTQRIPIPDLTLVILLPEIDLATTQMREVLPSSVLHQDAVYNLGHLTFTIEALRAGDFERLGKVMKDRIHQPFRIPLIPGYQEAERAALDAGASAVTLSGAGPAVVAFTPRDHETIANAMQHAFNASGLQAQRFILPVAQTGASVTSS